MRIFDVVVRGSRAKGEILKPQSSKTSLQQNKHGKENRRRQEGKSLDIKSSD
jgi:hypothetical protein